MRDDDMQDSDPEAVSSHARRLAEQGLHEQAQGHDAEADRLLSQALSITPERSMPFFSSTTPRALPMLGIRQRPTGMSIAFHRAPDR